MTERLRPPNDSPAIRVAVESGEPTTAALFRAAKRIGVDVGAADPPLHRAVDGDALDRLLETGPAAPEARATVSLTLWDHEFVLTGDEIAVYE